MTEQEAREWFYSILPDGLGDIRTKFIDDLIFYSDPIGIILKQAKTLSDNLDTNFLLGVEIGTMLALNKIFGILEE